MKILAAAIVLAALAVAAPAVAKEKARTGAAAGELILYQQTGFAGDYYSVDSNRTTIQTDWNIRSIAIKDGEKWQICAKPRFRDCIDLTQSIADASAIGVTGQIGSIRKVVVTQ
jgi:uncharacterized protein (UPF0333 family)